MPTKVNFKKDGAHNQVVPAIEPTTDVDVVTLSDSSQELEIPSGYEFVELASNGSFHYEFGSTGSVTASAADAVFPAGATVYKVPDGADAIAVIRASSDDDGKVVSVMGVQ